MSDISSSIIDIKPKKSKKLLIIIIAVISVIAVISTAIIIYFSVFSVKCKDKCNRNGKCNIKTGKCTCDKNVSGDRCNIIQKALLCNKKGSYDQTAKKCICDNKIYSGDKCQINICKLEPCLNDGICDPATGRCTCPLSSRGIEIKGDHCEDNCRNNAVYNYVTKKCDCRPGFTGEACEQTKCAIHNYCNRSGTCDPLTGKCTCDKNISGEFCDVYKPTETEIYIIINKNGFDVTEDCHITPTMNNILSKFPNTRWIKDWDFNPPNNPYDNGMQFPVVTYLPSDFMTEIKYFSVIQDNCLTNKIYKESVDIMSLAGAVTTKLHISQALPWLAEPVRKNIASKMVYGMAVYGIKPAKGSINIWDDFTKPPPDGISVLNWYTSCDPLKQNENRYSLFFK